MAGDDRAYDGLHSHLKVGVFTNLAAFDAALQYVGDFVAPRPEYSLAEDANEIWVSLFFDKQGADHGVTRAVLEDGLTLHDHLYEVLARVAGVWRWADLLSERRDCCCCQLLFRWVAAIDGGFADSGIGRDLFNGESEVATIGQEFEGGLEDDLVDPWIARTTCPSGLVL